MYDMDRIDTLQHRDLNNLYATLHAAMVEADARYRALPDPRDATSQRERDRIAQLEADALRKVSAIRVARTAVKPGCNQRFGWDQAQTVLDMYAKVAAEVLGKLADVEERLRNVEPDPTEPQPIPISELNRPRVSGAQQLKREAAKYRRLLAAIDHWSCIDCGHVYTSDVDPETTRAACPKCESVQTIPPGAGEPSTGYDFATVLASQYQYDFKKVGPWAVARHKALYNRTRMIATVKPAAHFVREMLQPASDTVPAPASEPTATVPANVPAAPAPADVAAA